MSDPATAADDRQADPDSRRSLVKEGKASVEREQALKFIRAFLDVKDGVKEIATAVVRTIVAVAEHGEDRLRSICIETLAEICRWTPPPPRRPPPPTSRVARRD